MVTRFAVVALFASGCTVERGAPDVGPWDCDADDDCLPDYGCLDLAPYGDPFCAPTTDKGCDGTVTAGRFCLDDCTIGGDECAEGFSCVRGFLPTGTQPEGLEDRVDTGYCLPVDTCTESTDCSDPDRPFCVSEYTENNEDYATDSLVCVATCDDNGDCASDELCSSGLGGEGGGVTICLPRCSDDDPCPPLFTCIDIWAEMPGGDAVCVPGVFPFMPCQDDPGCIVGQCLEALEPGQSFCSYSSCTIDELGFVCPEETIVPDESPIGFQCDSGVDVCGGRLSYLQPCTSDAISCAPPLACHQYGNDVPTFGELPPLCSFHCGAFWACPEGLYCAGLTEETAWCLPKQGAGTDCTFDAQCVSGTCLGRVCQ